MGIVMLMSNNPRRTPIALPQRPCPRTGGLLYLLYVVASSNGCGNSMVKTTKAIMALHEWKTN